MKKYFVLALMAMFTTMASAQLMTSRMSNLKGERATTCWFDFGAGLPAADASKGDGLGAGFDLGFRVTHMYTENLGWDIFRVKGQIYTKEVGPGDTSLSVSGQTGFRYVSPVLFSDKTLYGNAMFGAGYMAGPGEFLINWEIGAGINITKHFAAGLFYTCEHYKDHHENVALGLFGIRASVGF